MLLGSQETAPPAVVKGIIQQAPHNPACHSDKVVKGIIQQAPHNPACHGDKYFVLEMEITKTESPVLSATCMPPHMGLGRLDSKGRSYESGCNVQQNLGVQNNCRTTDVTQLDKHAITIAIQPTTTHHVAGLRLPCSSWNTEPPKPWATKSMLGPQLAAPELPAAPAWQSLVPSLGLQLGAARSCCTGTNTSRHASNKPCTMDEPMGGVQDPGWLDCWVSAACCSFTPTLKHLVLVVSAMCNTSDRGCRATSSDSSAGRCGSRRKLWKLATPPPLWLLAVVAV
jgi:hypothetical protein